MFLKRIDVAHCMADRPGLATVVKIGHKMYFFDPILFMSFFNLPKNPMSSIKRPQKQAKKCTFSTPFFAPNSQHLVVKPSYFSFLLQYVIIINTSTCRQATIMMPSRPGDSLAEVSFLKKQLISHISTCFMYKI